MTDLTGRVALVTGGANGQGAAHVRRLLSDGATVHFADVDVAAGKAFEDSLHAAGLRRTRTSSTCARPSSGSRSSSRSNASAAGSTSS